MTRQEAIYELLSRPDESALAGKRGSHITQPGDPDVDIVKQELGRAHLAHRWHEHRDVSAIILRRTGMKIVRRA